MSDDLRGFQKLTKDNWDSWSYIAKNRLIKKGYWANIDPTLAPPSHIIDTTSGLQVVNPTHTTWQASSAERIPDLVELVDPSLIPLIRHATTALEQWIILQLRFEQTSQISQSALRSEFYSLQLGSASKDAVDAFLARFDAIISKLAISGVTVSDHEQFSKLVTATRNVPKFTTAIEALETTMRNQPATIQDVLYLLNLIRERADPDPSSTTPADSNASALTSYVCGNCFACRRAGHCAADCTIVTTEVQDALLWCLWGSG